MTRLAKRINDCKHLCCQNMQLMPELFGLQDAEAGTRTHEAHVWPKERAWYERGYADGLLLRAIDQEAGRGSCESQSAVSVLLEAHQ